MKVHPSTKSYDREFFFEEEIFPKNSICVEIGIFRGILADRIVDKLTPKMYHMIDPWKHRPKWKHQEYKGRKLISQKDVDWLYKDICKRFNKPNVKIHRGYSQIVVHEFKNEYFDLIYVDGRHTYKQVLEDLRLFYPKLKVGGIMSGDDYMIEKPHTGVIRAVNKFAEEIGIEFNVRSRQFWWTKLGG